MNKNVWKNRKQDKINREKENNKKENQKNGS